MGGRRRGMQEGRLPALRPAIAMIAARIAGTAALLIAAFTTTAAWADAPGVVAPHVSITSFAELPRATLAAGHPAVAAGGARTAIARASARARRDGKRVLIAFGADWCLYCRLFEAMIALPEMRGFVARHFEFVSVDVGAFDRNLGIARRYGIGRLVGVPTLLVIDPVTSRPVATGIPWARADIDLVRPQTIADWLARAAAPTR